MSPYVRSTWAIPSSTWSQTTSRISIRRFKALKRPFSTFLGTKPAAHFTKSTCLCPQRTKTSLKSRLTYHCNKAMKFLSKRKLSSKFKNRARTATSASSRALSFAQAATEPTPTLRRHWLNLKDSASWRRNRFRLRNTLTLKVWQSKKCTHSSRLVSPRLTRVCTWSSIGMSKWNNSPSLVSSRSTTSSCKSLDQGFCCQSTWKLIRISRTWQTLDP